MGAEVVIYDDEGMSPIEMLIGVEETIPWGEGIPRTAGALADDPGWDDIMEGFDRQPGGLLGTDSRPAEVTTW
jgi:hypothetical protein